MLAIRGRVVQVHRMMRLRRLGLVWTVAIVGLLLLCFGVVSFTAVLGKSATYDEPLHLVGGLVHRYDNDYRINPEDPALFGWWASLPQSRDSLTLDRSNAFFEGATSDSNQQWWFVVDALYGHDPAHADQVLDRSRFMFVIVGMGLGALIACWAYQLGGPWAAIAAAALFCFDPNFLAHSALVKNDVMLSLMMCLLGFFLWRFGKFGRWHWLALAALACGLAFNVKFSAVLFGPMAVLLLILRAVLPKPWTIGGRLLQKRWQRTAIVLTGTVAMMLAAYVLTWWVYGFRYAATADGQAPNCTPLIAKAVSNTLVVRYQEGNLGKLTNEEFQGIVDDRLKNQEYPLPVTVDLWLQKHHVLPEGWLFGFLYTYATTLVRSTYLLEHVAVVGTWTYFPLAMLFKTPTATLFALFLVPVTWLAALWVRRILAEEEDDNDEPSGDAKLDWWTICVLAIPPAIYFASALMTNLNLGLRHILPVYPYLFVVLGVGIGTLLERWPRASGMMATLLVLGLVTETAISYPNYLAFFNVLSGGSEGGLRLLGDSNLDWGQDLPALAAWRKGHPDGQLLLCYFGMADPRAYGIDFVNLPGGWPFVPAAHKITDDPGVLAISATNLQGIYLGDLAKRYHEALNGEKPFKILNGTIYLFTWPPVRPEEGGG
jgi:hypothetical protein